MSVIESRGACRARVRNVGGAKLIAASCRDYAFPRHFHEGFTIGIVTEGREIINTRNETHRLQAGDVYFNNPGETHDGRSFECSSWSFQSLYVSPRGVGDDGGKPLEFSSFMSESAAVSKRVKEAFAVLAISACALEIESALLSVLRAGHRQDWEGGYRSLPSERRKVGNVKAFIDAHYTEDISLRQLSVLAELNETYLIESFKRATGLTPHAYLVARRVNAAYHAIKGGSSIACAAVDCGFYDQSHLHRHFFCMLGVTPKAVARAFDADRI